MTAPSTHQILSDALTREVRVDLNGLYPATTVPGLPDQAVHSVTITVYPSGAMSIEGQVPSPLSDGWRPHNRVYISLLNNLDKPWLTNLLNDLNVPYPQKGTNHGS